MSQPPSSPSPPPSTIYSQPQEGSLPLPASLFPTYSPREQRRREAHDRRERSRRLAAQAEQEAEINEKRPALRQNVKRRQRLGQNLSINEPTGIAPLSTRTKRSRSEDTNSDEKAGPSKAVKLNQAAKDAALAKAMQDDFDREDQARRGLGGTNLRSGYGDRPMPSPSPSPPPDVPHPVSRWHVEIFESSRTDELSRQLDLTTKINHVDEMLFNKSIVGTLRELQRSRVSLDEDQAWLVENEASVNAYLEWLGKELRGECGVGGEEDEDTDEGEE